MPTKAEPWIVAMALICLSHPFAAGGSLIRMGVSDLETQRIEGDTNVVLKGAVPFSQLSVLVTVDAAGRVIDAQPSGDNLEKVDIAPALAAVRRWHFRPQTFLGKPVLAVGMVTVSYAPPEDLPDTSVPFPRSAPADTEITLERTPCYGSCPDYTVSVRGNGSVHFRTLRDGVPAYHHFVLLPGDHVARVDPALVTALIGKFRDASFFGLKPTYEADVTDLSTEILTFRAGQQSKRVVDYAGEAIGMPASVSLLEQAIDAVAGTERWVSGNTDTVALLEAEGFDFRSDAARNLAVTAVQMPYKQERGVGAMILAMVNRGLPLDGPARSVPGSLGALLAKWSAWAGDEMLFDVMMRKGFVARMNPGDLNMIFASDMGCSPRIAKALVQAGADPKAAAKDGTALTAIRTSRSACRAAGEDRFVEMARTLINLGVPPDARDGGGATALIGCNDPALAGLLLERGADLNAKDKYGTTPLLGTDDDRVAVLLLRAGADPRAGIGKLREHVAKGSMPATRDWLDARGIK